jgi:hypothetical protein
MLHKLYSAFMSVRPVRIELPTSYLLALQLHFATPRVQNYWNIRRQQSKSNSNERTSSSLS